MKLVEITTVPESLHGFLRERTAYLKRRGCEIHVISSPGESLDEFARVQQVPAYGVAMQRRITPFKDLTALWRIYRTLRALRPEIVHARTPKGGVLGSLAAWLARVPVRLYTIHGLPMMTATGFKRQLLKWTERISCWCAHEVLCVSHSVREVAVQEGLCPADKIKVLGRGSSAGVDAAGRFHPTRHVAEAREIRCRHGIGEDDLVIGFVGRVVRDKGMAELAAAWQVLRGRFPRLHLLLIGPFEPQDPIPSEVEKLFRTDPRIHVLGPIKEPASYYAAMDVFVLPTYREGLGAVLLEAAAMQVPTVATRIPGCYDAVEDGVTGLLVPPYDAQALAEALRRLLVSPSLRRRFGVAGRARVLRDFRPEVLHQMQFEEYCALLHARGLAAPQRDPVTESVSSQGMRAA